MSDTHEILQTVERLHGALADLVVRGLRAAGREQLALLASLRQELERIGGHHLASRLADLLDGLRQGERSAAAALLRAQTSLRLFERILTLEHAADLLQELLPAQEDQA
jgi:hypothetical protein